MLVTVPIFLSDRIIDTKVEIQIRTMAMDFWASLEHKIYYKFEGNAPDYISRDLRECSGIVSMLDAKMLQLNEAILEAKAAQEEQEGDTGCLLYTSIVPNTVMYLTSMRHLQCRNPFRSISIRLARTFQCKIHNSIWNCLLYTSRCV